MQIRQLRENQASALQDKAGARRNDQQSQSLGLAIVTGAGSGIGAAIALRLAQDGYALGIIDLREAAAKQVAAVIQGRGGLASASAADVSNSIELGQAIDACVRSMGPLEVMVNNAGVLDGYFDVHDMDETIWRRVIDVNLTSVFIGSKKALEHMLPQSRGAIINMASVAGLNGTGGGAAYIAAKHGVVGITRQMAVRYGAMGIRVNSVCPGAIPTALREHSQAILGPDVPDMSQRGVAVNDDQVRALVPMGKRGDVSDIAQAVSFLASPAASYIQGHALVVDGGWRAK